MRACIKDYLCTAIIYFKISKSADLFQNHNYCGKTRCYISVIFFLSKSKDDDTQIVKNMVNIELAVTRPPFTANMYLTLHLMN